MEVAPAFLQGVWRDSAVAFGDTATVSELCRQTATAASGGSSLVELLREGCATTASDADVLSEEEKAIEDGLPAAQVELSALLGPEGAVLEEAWLQQALRVSKLQ